MEAVYPLACMWLPLCKESNGATFNQCLLILDCDFNTSKTCVINKNWGLVAFLIAMLFAAIAEGRLPPGYILMSDTQY